MKTKLSKGTISLLWRFGAVILIAVLDAIAANLGMFDIPVELVTILGLILGEITKQIRISNLSK